MLAIRSLPVLAVTTPAPERPRHPILTSILPALDTAFGLEPAVLFPEAIAALVERLAAVLDAPPTAPILTAFDFLEAA
jgi:hypothetical protein